jgi:hypothetical protein
MSITTNKAASADASLALAAGARRAATCTYALLDTTASQSAWLPVQCDQCLVYVCNEFPSNGSFASCQCSDSEVFI